MTNTDSSSSMNAPIMNATDRMLAVATQRFARQVPQTSDFAPLDRKPDTSRNAQRGTPKKRRNKTIL